MQGEMGLYSTCHLAFLASSTRLDGDWEGDLGYQIEVNDNKNIQTKPAELWIYCIVSLKKDMRERF